MSIDKQIYNQAIKRKLPPTVANLLIAQARYESRDYTSPVFNKNTNLFGYKYVGQSGATQGSEAPKNEWPSPNKKGYYAKYKSVEDSANEVINWLYRRQQEGKFLIADLTTAGKYAAGLKAGDYYGESAANYSNGLTAKLKKINFASGSNETMAGVFPIVLIVGLAFSLLRK